MRTQGLSRLSDAALVHDMKSLAAQECAAMADVLARIAEVDARRLYLPAGYPSMYAYCVGELPFSEDAAYKRIQAARAARKFPAIFDALAEGRLHLAGVCLLAPHLDPENAEVLIAAATRKTKADIEQLLARRFPGTESLALVQSIPAAPARNEQLAPGQVGPGQLQRAAAIPDQLAPGQVEAPRARVKPVAPERFALQCMLSKDTYDKLQHLQALLSHQLPSGDLAQVLDRALDISIAHLEKRKFAATRKPRLRRGSTANPRHIPAHVKRAVRERDQGQCTFVGDTGQRCQSRKFLEYDHVEPVARGGKPTVDNVRLRCRAHNQFEAERVFGAGFMNEKRKETRRAAESRRTAVAEARIRATAQEHAKDVMAGLRELGVRADQARRAIEFCQTIPATTLEERMRAALRFLGPRPRSESGGGKTVSVPS
jgi:5-methylcytosine-specific restriction endonuclease McrA